MKYRPTINILEMADTLEHFAQKLRTRAELLEQTGDLGYIGEAINVFNNLFLNINLSSLFNNTLREKEQITPAADVKLGAEQKCPNCGQSNPSGKNLPKDCMFCKGQ